MREAGAIAPEGHRHRQAVLYNLSNALEILFEHVLDLGELDEAVSVGREMRGNRLVRVPECRRPGPGPTELR
jgi:hypothetical protein